MTASDIEQHLRLVAQICASSDNTMLELGNEPFHPTQADVVHDPAQLQRWGHGLVPAGVLYALGAAQDDESADFTGGNYVTVHLDRGRDKWNQVRRIRELANLSEQTRKPVMSNEPIGAAEETINGKRESDPSFFFALGALCRGFEIGAIFHSSAGLAAEPLGPVQRACAEAFIAGGRAIDTEARLSFFNSTWGSSPVAGADFSRVVRAYSFVTGGNGYTALVGLSGDPALRWANGWSDRGVIAERPGIQLRRIGQ